ncbi:MAG: zinc-dependent metalloprotease [Actinomycetota bacterium]
MNEDDDSQDQPPMPFGLPFFGDLSALLGGMGGDGAWRAARQLAFTLATEGTTEPNVDPSVRIEIEQLARVAELQVSQATGLSPAGGEVRVTAVTRTQWADKAIDAYKPLFEKLTESLGQQPDLPDEDEFGAGDPATAMFGQMMKMIGPMMLSMTAGSMVGHMARRSIGQYDIPVPRSGDEILIVPGNLDEFGEDWSLDSRDLRLWVCLHEIAHHLVLGVPHIGGTIERLMLEHAGAFRSDPTALEQKLGALDLSNPAALGELQSTLNDPEVILGAIRSPEQEAIKPQLEAVTALVVGIVDHVMDSVGDGLLSSYGQLTEALRRRRVEADPADRFIERMLGLELTQEQYDRGAAFVDGVVERAGTDGLFRLWEDERMLPTPNELDAPGLWLARIDLPLD